MVVAGDLLGAQPDALRAASAGPGRGRWATLDFARGLHAAVLGLAGPGDGWAGVGGVGKPG